ncbi:hypothetical protein EGW08_011921 [Elysia chlorotica]|uniref:Apextrin C-terminal domain-containing protein n=1 Tax=Elysia chlorotica TaxID=188477 RepID=A0A433TFI2_ELYCH|nr:hypothetical protein EGW08_011921 [Elysia chlorotica]
MPSVTMVSFALLCLLLILQGYASGVLFEITSSRRELNFLYEESLEIECAFNPDHADDEGEIKFVEAIHIVRRDSKKRWTELARLMANGFLEVPQSNYTAQGLITPNVVNNTYLKINWDIASEAEIGIYRCDVVVKDDDYKFDVQESNTLNILKHNVTTDELLDISRRQLDDLQLEFGRFRKKTVQKITELEKSVLELKNESRIEDDENENDISETYLDQLKKDITRSVLANVSAELEDMTCSRLAQCSVSSPTNPKYSGTTKPASISFTTNFSKATSGTTAQKLSSSTKPPKRAFSTTLLNSATTRSPQTTRSITPNYVSTKPPKTTRRTTVPKPASTQAPSTVQATEVQVPGLPWPEGNFALLNSKSGCPRTSASPVWWEGYMMYHTESMDENHDNVTYMSNLAEPIMQVDRFGNNFLIMHFCTSYNSTSQPWPPGAYCMNRVTSKCPAGFQSGYMDIDEEDINYSGQSHGTLPEMLFFCCRRDGDPNVPVALPNSRPFYLYRFGGQCQEVVGMQVRPETMLFDTENENNQDDYQNENHPDGKLTDVELELCYYS